MESNATYFSRRAREELFAAIKASHSKARRAHLDLAARYDDLSRAIEAKERKSEAGPDEPGPDACQAIHRTGIWV